jgi:hypothetical protein
MAIAMLKYVLVGVTNAEEILLITRRYLVSYQY